MNRELRNFLIALSRSARDLTPIVLVIAFFQIAIIQQPFQNAADLIAGMMMVVIGLVLTVQ